MTGQYRYPVKGYWRKQWKPSIGQHVNVWIEPHIRGPHDGPLVVKDPPPPLYKDHVTPTTDVDNKQVFLVEGHWRTGPDGKMYWVEPGVMDPEQHARDIAEFMEQQQEEQDE